MQNNATNFQWLYSVYWVNFHSLPFSLSQTHTCIPPFQKYPVKYLKSLFSANIMSKVQKCMCAPSCVAVVHCSFIWWVTINNTDSNLAVSVNTSLQWNWIIKKIIQENKKSCNLVFKQVVNSVLLCTVLWYSILVLHIWVFFLLFYLSWPSLLKSVVLGAEKTFKCAWSGAGGRFAGGPKDHA